MFITQTIRLKCTTAFWMCHQWCFLHGNNWRIKFYSNFILNWILIYSLDIAIRHLRLDLKIYDFSLGFSRQTNIILKKKIGDGSMRLTARGNRLIYETSSNLDCGSFHLLRTNALGKGMEPLLPPQTMNK